MKAQRRILDFGRRIQGWFPIDPVVASPPVALELRVSRALKSLGLAIGVSFVVLLGALYGAQAIFGLANNAPFVLFGIAVLAAILFVGFSVRSFKCTSSRAAAKAARNVIVGLLAGFLFTVATSSYYDASLLSKVGSPIWWDNFQQVMMAPFWIWASVAFLAVTIFSFDYSRRRVRF
jgi:hypothetical protein